MNPNPLDPSLANLNACGCCEGTQPSTPRASRPRPGLPALSLRSGSHPEFLASLLASLSNSAALRQPLLPFAPTTASAAAPPPPALARLRTRAPDDFTIGLLDAFACMADVLSFYSERLANESFLRTATERRSVLWLARATGYELKPGVAASTWLAFTVESAPGSPGWAKVDAGTRVQSIPGPGEQPQTFETLQPFDARHEWNELRPQSRKRVTPSLNQTTIHLAGIATNLKPGDPILIVGDERLKKPANENWDFRRVQSIATVPNADPTKAYTVVTLDKALGIVVANKNPPPSTTKIEPAQKHPRVYALRLRARLFGHGAPEWLTLPQSVRDKITKTANSQDNDWPNFTIQDVSGSVPPGKSAAICLDAIYPTIAKESWIVLSSPDDKEAYRVTSVGESAPRKFTLTHQVTRLGLEEGKTPKNLKAFNEHLRETAVFAQSEELPWADVPFATPVVGNNVTLDRSIPNLPPGRPLLFQGRRAQIKLNKDHPWTPDSTPPPPSTLSAETVVSVLDNSTPNWRVQTADGTIGRLVSPPSDSFQFIPADPQSDLVHETVVLKGSSTQDGLTVLELETPLANAYDPASLVIFANLALATHGESVLEPLGHGDPSRPHQQVRLRKAPLTFIPAANDSGRESSLQVTVNGVRWSEVSSLYNQPPTARAFVARRSNDGITTLVFGDGRFGARPPSGQENISARYRQGIGIDGAVGPGKLNLLLSRPLGIKSVTNPSAAAGAENPESLDDARVNAPSQTLALGRVVSLADYRDFARTFAGVARAHAAWTWSPSGRSIYLSVLGPNGASLPTGPGTTLDNLARALRSCGNPLVPLTVQPGLLVPFQIHGTIHVAADRSPATVLATVRHDLKSAFGFAARDFAQPIAQSEVVAIIQAIPGVVFANMTLSLTPTSPSTTSPPNASFLNANHTRDGAAASEAIPARLLVLDEPSLAKLVASTLPA